MHGTRAALKTWAAASLRHPPEVIEMALAHRTGNKIAVAYFDEEAHEIQAARRKLYREWSAFLMGETGEQTPPAQGSATSAADNVVALRAA
jgi:hypothetical protein